MTDMAQVNVTHENEEAMAVNRKHKSRIFEMVFSDKKELLALYNAVNGTQYDDPDKLVVNTLENAIYMAMHNDISFIIDSRLSLYEHQSTYSPNLPLRCLFYVSRLYSRMTKDRNLYGSVAMPFPAPRFVIFYNGGEKRPEREILKLSDLYSPEDETPSLELTAVFLNINPGCNEELKDSCKTLRDYSEYTAKVRKYAKGMPLKEAVEKAVDECIREEILADFLKANKAEAVEMSIFEYDEEKHMRQTREEGKMEGRIEGRIEGKIEDILELLEELGDIPEELRDVVRRQTDLAVLGHWLKLAARAGSMEEFREKIAG